MNEDQEPEVWTPEDEDDNKLCTTARLGPRPGTDKFCVHLKDHEGDHHFEGDYK